MICVNHQCGIILLRTHAASDEHTETYMGIGGPLHDCRMNRGTTTLGGVRGNQAACVIASRRPHLLLSLPCSPHSDRRVDSPVPNHSSPGLLISSLK